MTLWGPGLSGSVAVTLVETHNATLSGAGRKRVEYFAQHLSSEDDILNNSTSCATARGHGGAFLSVSPVSPKEEKKKKTCIPVGAPLLIKLRERMIHERTSERVVDDHGTRRGGGGRGGGGGGHGDGDDDDDDDDDAHVGNARSAPHPHGAGVLPHSRQSGVHSGVLSVWFVRRDVRRVRGMGRPPRRRQGRPCPLTTTTERVEPQLETVSQSLSLSRVTTHKCLVDSGRVDIVHMTCIQHI